MTNIAPHRIGRPSPLITHLNAATVGYLSAISLAASGKLPEFDWHPELSDQTKDMEALDQLELAQSAVVRLRGLVSGIQKWQTHPYRRAMSEPREIWHEGSSRLLDYGTCAEAATKDGPPILVVPSLINRPYILDLRHECSLLRYLSAQGLRPLLLDWGIPSDEELEFDLNSYASKRLMTALDTVQSSSKQRVGILGYCMGGTLAAGVIAQNPTGIGAFATIGSPWDFSAYEGITETLSSIAADFDASKVIENIGHTFGMIPSDYLQHLFAIINPMQAAVKFRKFDLMDQKSDSAKQFVAIEDWLADGVPLTAPSAKNLLVDWNLENQTAIGRWELFGSKVDVGSINIPTLNVCGKRDSITQLPVASAMSAQIPGARLLTPDAGHVGMIVGGKARETVWKPVANFFSSTLT